MEETPWLDEAERAAWVRLASVMLLLPGALDAQLQQDAGMTHFEYFVMAMLSEAPGGELRMSELASLSTSSLSRLSHVVSRLERKGWVSRRPSARDGRATVASLTDAGRRVVVDTAPGHVRTVRRLVFDPLQPGQVDQLTAVLDALLGVLDPEGKTSPTTPPPGPRAC